LNQAFEDVSRRCEPSNVVAPFFWPTQYNKSKCLQEVQKKLNNKSKINSQQIEPMEIEPNGGICTGVSTGC